MFSRSSGQKDDGDSAASRHASHQRDGQEVGAPMQQTAEASPWEFLKLAERRLNGRSFGGTSAEIRRLSQRDGS
jgi:hypothetical protein